MTDAIQNAIEALRKLTNLAANYAPYVLYDTTQELKNEVMLALITPSPAVWQKIELLEALEHLLEFQQYVGCGIPEDAYGGFIEAKEKADAAIAKATAPIGVG